MGSVAEIENEWNCTSVPAHAFMVCKKKLNLLTEIGTVAVMVCRCGLSGVSGGVSARLGR